MKEISNIIKSLATATSGFLSKAGSRKFIVLLIATHAMYSEILNPQDWTLLSMAWMGVHGGTQAINSFRQKDDKGRSSE